MTYYNYMSDMQQFCFRITQAAIVLKDKALQDFYYAAEEGFNIHANQLSISEAKANIGQNQIEAFLRTKKFCEKKEEEAAYKLKEEQQYPCEALNKFKRTLEKCCEIHADLKAIYNPKKIPECYHYVQKCIRDDFDNKHIFHGLDFLSECARRYFTEMQKHPAEENGAGISYEEWEEMLDDNQLAEKQLEVLNGCN